MAWGVGPYFPMPLFFGVYMFKEVICRSCDGNGCVNCCRNGVVYVEIDEPTLALQDEISELKKKLEIAKEALNIIKKSHPTSDQNWIIVQKALEEIERAGE